MRKLFYLLLAALVLVGCSSVPRLEDRPIGNRGLLHFSTVGDWPAAIVHIDGKDQGRLSDHHSAIALRPGDYRLTGFRRHSGYQGQYVSTLSLDIPFSIEAGKVTSLGKLVLLRRGSEGMVVILEDTDSAKRLLSMYYPVLSASFGDSDYQSANINYVPQEQIDAVRQEYLRQYSRRVQDQGDFRFGEIGTIAVRKDGANELIESSTLDRLYPAVQTPAVSGAHYFTYFGDIFCYCDGEITKIDSPDDTKVAALAVSERLTVIADNRGRVKYSVHGDDSWLSLPERLSSVYMTPYFNLFEEKLFAGPLTVNYNADRRNSRGVVFNIDTEQAEIIGWSDHITNRTRFYVVNGEYLFDPVNLRGNATFLFRYDSRRKRWDEIRLPNRHCSVNVQDDTVGLDCRRGSNFESRDGGRSWQEL